MTAACRLAIALIAAHIAAGFGVAVAQPALPTASGTLALNARALRAKRTAAGFTLGGEALASDACRTARFERSPSTVFPPAFNVMQFRPRSMMGAMCMRRASWVTIAPVFVAMPLQIRVNVITKSGAQLVPVAR